MKQQFWVENLTKTHDFSQKDCRDLLWKIMENDWKYEIDKEYEFLFWTKNLEKLLNQKQNLKKWLWLDVDDTLSSSTEFLFKHFNDIYWNPENLDHIQMMEKYKKSYYVPFWDEKEMRKMLLEMQVNNDIIANIGSMWNVWEIYSDIHEKIIPISAYISARSEEIIEWTQIWNQKNNMPNADYIFLPMWIHPAFWMYWKSKVLKVLSWKIVWIVDDSKELSSYLNNWNWNMFLFNSKENELNAENLTVCENLESVKYHVINKYGISWKN